MYLPSKKKMETIEQQIMETIEQQIKSAFNSVIDFKPNDIAGGFGCTKKFLNGFEISIQCSAFHYCTPRENLNSPNDYSSFEVAVFNANGDWVTSKFFEDCGGDMVKGWATRPEIISAIRRIIETN